jgi:hypothetical protein
MNKNFLPQRIVRNSSLKIIFLVLVTALILFCNLFFAPLYAYNNPDIDVKKIGTFYFNDLLSKVSSSSLTYDFPINKGYGGEFIFQSLGSVYLLGGITTQISLHAKNNLLNWGWFSLNACEGITFISEKGVGSSTALDLGFIPVINFSSNTYLSAPIVASVFADGAIVNFFLGITYKTKFMGVDEIVFGYKAIGVTKENSGNLISQLTLGLRFNLTK